MEDRLTVLHICDLRNLALALVEKCTTDPDADQYNGEDGQPWNVEPVFSVNAAFFCHTQPQLLLSRFTHNRVPSISSRS